MMINLRMPKKHQKENKQQETKSQDQDTEKVAAQSGVSDIAPTVQLEQIQTSFLERARCVIKPGKVQNDEIVLRKLNEELRPLQTRAQHSIKPLGR